MNFSTLQTWLEKNRWGRKGLYALLALAVAASAFGLRVYAANRLPIDYDEPVYLEAALQYNNYLREGRWTMVAWNDTNAEHPVFYKLVYGVALFVKPPIQRILAKDFHAMQPIQKAEGKPWGMVGRVTSAVFGGLAALALALVNPLAGLLFGINTLAIKFTSTFFLEALPVFATLMGMLCYQRWYERYAKDRQPYNWINLFFSAGFFGMAIASKYTYAVAPLAAGLHALTGMAARKLPARALAWLAVWGALVVAAFFVCDPYLWKHTAQRLAESVSFHADYSQSIWVTRYDYPFWQPLAWFSASFGQHFPAEAPAFLIQLDPLISLLALVGLPRLFQRRRVFFFWLVVGMIMLLAWPTKWPQYTMIVIAPLCLSAALGAGWVWEKVRSIQPARAGTGG